MVRRPPIPTRTDPLLPTPTLVRSGLGKMKDDIDSIDGGSSGLVGVGGLAYSRKTLLPEAIRRTLWAFPRIVVRTVEGPIGALIGAMHAGDIDALICAR